MEEIDDTATSCSVERAIDIVGGKWKLYLIRVLMVSGPQRFNGLLHAIDDISPKVLTENLRSLERDGVIERVDTDNVQVYALTSSGEGLQTALHIMGEWAEKHDGPSNK